MKMRWLLLGGVLILPLILDASASQVPAETGEVWGKVINPETGEPVEGILVVVAEEKVAATSGEDGNFVLGPLPLGRTEILFQHPCFYPLSVEVRLSPQAPRRRVSVGVPYDYETEVRTGCDWRLGKVPAGEM